MRMLLYKNGSQTGRLIAETLNASISRGLRSREPIINWGSGVDRKVKLLPRKWLNTRESVDIAKDKLKTFQKLENNVNIPEFTTSKTIAQQWVDEDVKVYCRTLTRGNRGRGIVIAETFNEVVTAPLYTKKVNADREYRIHVFQNEVLGVQRKIETEEGEILSHDIRNHRFGWRFSLRDLDRVHEGIKELGINAVRVLGLDFGAVDMLWNKEEEVGYILEVNTAPAIEPDSTIFNKYIDNMRRWYDE